MKTFLETFEGITRKELVQMIIVGAMLPAVGYLFYCVVWMMSK